MKKFITGIPMLPEGSLHRVSYETEAGETLLRSDIETRFPAMLMIDSSVEKDEKIEIVVIKTEHTNTENNYKAFLSELDEIKQKKGFEYKITEIQTTLSETPEKQYELLEKIVENLSDGDEVYSDITYGAKPTPIVIMMAMNYAYEYLKNTDVRAMIYGSYNHATGKTSAYDVSSLFYMNSLMNKISGGNHENPLEVMKAIINL